MRLDVVKSCSRLHIDTTLDLGLCSTARPLLSFWQSSRVRLDSLCGWRYDVCLYPLESLILLDWYWDWSRASVFSFLKKKAARYRKCSRCLKIGVLGNRLNGKVVLLVAGLRFSQFYCRVLWMVTWTVCSGGQLFVWFCYFGGTWRLVEFGFTWFRARCSFLCLKRFLTCLIDRITFVRMLFLVFLGGNGLWLLAGLLVSKEGYVALNSGLK